jgi:hypothetical protein
MKEPLIELNGWVTIKTLAAKKGCSTNYLSKLIKQNKLQVKEYPELNNLRLVPGDFFKPKL